MATSLSAFLSASQTGPQRSIWKRPSSKHTSIPPFTHPLPACSSWQRRMEACCPLSITGPSIRSPSNFIIHFTYPSHLGTALWNHSLHQAGPQKRIQPQSDMEGGEWKTAYVTHSWHQHFVLVLEKLWKFHLDLNVEKCTFHQASTQFLRYHTSAKRIKMDEGRLKQGYPSSFQPLLKRSNSSWVLTTSTILSRKGALSQFLKSKPKSLSWSQGTTHSFQRLKCALRIKLT